MKKHIRLLTLAAISLAGFTYATSSGFITR